MNASDFVSCNHVIAEVVSIVDDKAFRNGFAKGWYVSRVQDAMQELAMDTFFQKIQKDCEFPDSCQLPMPENVFNPREIYLYSGTLCNPTTTQNVYYKRLFNNNYEGDGYTAKIKDDQSNPGDLFVPNHIGISGETKYYANVQNGVIMFSRECLAYKYVRIIFNGFGTPVGDIPIIPKFFEQPVKDWVKMKFYEAMKGRQPRKYRSLWADAQNDLYNNQRGSWNKARNRVKKMNNFERESMDEYVSNVYAK